MSGVPVNTIKQALENSFSYADYRNKVTSLIAEGKSTGHEQSEDLLKYWEEILDVQFKEEYELWYKFKEESETLNNKIICLINLS